MLKNIYFFSTIIWAAIISVFCLVQFKSVPLGTVSHLDKVVHAFFYFVLTFLLQLFLNESKANWSKKVVKTYSFVSAILFGIVIELVQETCTATRHADVLDVLANTTGALLSIGAYSMYERIKLKHKY
ncbi:VanZ family protein [Flavobacterium sp. GNP001]